MEFKIQKEQRDSVYSGSQKKTHAIKIYLVLT